MRTLTVKLYGSDDFGYLGDMINIAGIIYNTALTIIQDHYTETGKLLDKYELQKQLRDLRNADENRHWRYVGSQAVQDITDRIYRAYRLFFTNKKKGVKCSSPRRRKVMGSNGYDRALKALYRRHRDIANRRRDWFWKLSHELCSRYGVIAIEDLNIKGMAKLWGRKVHDYAFSEFVEILEWCASKYGTRVIRIGRYCPSSQTCSACGHVWQGTRDLSVREWTCPECGVTHDRDVNAAVNILAEAKRIMNRMEQAKDA